MLTDYLDAPELLGFSTKRLIKGWFDDFEKEKSSPESTAGLPTYKIYSLMEDVFTNERFHFRIYFNGWADNYGRLRNDVLHIVNTVIYATRAYESVVFGSKEPRAERALWGVVETACRFFDDIIGHIELSCRRTSRQNDSDKERGRNVYDEAAANTIMDFQEKILTQARNCLLENFLPTQAEYKRVLEQLMNMIDSVCRLSASCGPLTQVNWCNR